MRAPKPKAGRLLRFAVLKPCGKAPHILPNGSPAHVMAFTPKSAKHQARAAFGSGVRTAPAP
jgi:hypothetical protein